MEQLGSMQISIVKRMMNIIIMKKVVSLQNYQHIMEKKMKFYLKIVKMEKSKTMR